MLYIQGVLLCCALSADSLLFRIVYCFICTLLQAALQHERAALAAAERQTAAHAARIEEQGSGLHRGAGQLLAATAAAAELAEQLTVRYPSLVSRFLVYAVSLVLDGL